MSCIICSDPLIKVVIQEAFVSDVRYDSSAGSRIRPQDARDLFCEMISQTELRNQELYRKVKYMQYSEIHIRGSPMILTWGTHINLYHDIRHSLFFRHSKKLALLSHFSSPILSYQSLQQSPTVLVCPSQVHMQSLREYS